MVTIVCIYSLLFVLYMHACAPVCMWCCFQIGAFMNNIIMKHLVRMSWCTGAKVFMPRGGISGSDDIHVFSFSLENASVFKKIALVCTPTSNG